jgi:thiamine-phosphate pyrophosphorylase
VQAMTRKIHFDPTLYVIADAAVLRREDAVRLLEGAIAGGASAVQIRAKNLTDREFVAFAGELLLVARARAIPVIVNDRVDIAMAIRADGVHLGADDIPVPDARRLLGGNAIIGVTAHSLDEVGAAADLDVDYVGFGSVYPSPSKVVGVIQGTDGVRRARKLTRLPIVAIGGITAERAEEVIAAGADGVAVISGVWHSEDPKARARQYIEAIARARAKDGGRR